MKTKRSFLISLLLHAGLISGAVALAAFPTEEKDEEIILELSLSEPSAPQPVPKSAPPQSTHSLPQPPHPAPPQLPVAEESKMTETIASPEPPKSSVFEPQPIESPQEHSAEPKVISSAPVIQPAVAQINAEEQYLDNHLATIRDLLVKYRKYPSQALRLKQEGSVKVSFRLKQNGDIEDIRIVGSSGYEMLDEDAKALIHKTAEYFPKPPKSVRITVPLNYRIRG